MKRFALTLLAAALAAPAALHAESVGVNFGSDTDLAATTSAGVAPYAQTRWNNVTGNVTNLALNNNLGIATSTRLTLTNAAVSSFLPLPAGGDETLNSSSAYSLYSDSVLSFTLSNIPYGSYSLVVYDLFDAPNFVQSINAGGTTYYTRSPNPGAAGYVDGDAGTAFTYTRGTGTTAATATVNGDYVLFTDLSTPSLTVTLKNVTISNDFAECAGFQIINTAAVPEPSTGAVLCAGAGIFGVAALRRRRAGVCA